MGKRIYDEGNMEARKSPAPRSIMHIGCKSKKEVNILSSEGKTDISHLRSLIGREIEVTVPVDTHDIEKKGQIIMLYPHCAMVAYNVGRPDAKQHELYTCVTTAELVEKGFISFANGKPEVVNL